MAILEYKVVFFRGQHLDRDQHAAFAAQFGPLYTHPHGKQAQPDSVTAIHRIAATDAKEFEKVREVRDSEGWDPYHTDTSWRLVPTWGAVLRAVNLPDVGGDTVWVDAGAAYENLPDDVKERLEGLHVTHDTGRRSIKRASTIRSSPTRSFGSIARRESGSCGLIYSAPLDHRSGPGGKPRAPVDHPGPVPQTRASGPLHVEPGSIAFWDNRAAVHYAVRNYGDFPRLLERILIADEPQYTDL